MHRHKDLLPFSAKKQAWLQDYRPSPIFELLDIRLLKLEPGYSLLLLPVRKELTHSGGIVQGGIISTLADSAIAFAPRSALPDDTRQTSIDLKMNFMRPLSSPAKAGLCTWAAARWWENPSCSTSRARRWPNAFPPY